MTISSFLSRSRTVNAYEIGQGAVEGLRELAVTAGDSTAKFMFTAAYEFGLKYESVQMKVNPTDVHCNPWSKDRLGSLMKLDDTEFRETFSGRPPQLNGYRLADNTVFYSVENDGNHRIAAAKLRRFDEVPCSVTMFESLPGKTYALNTQLDGKTAGPDAESRVIYAREWAYPGLDGKAMAMILVAMGASEVRFR